MQISAVVIVKNEETNIQRCLEGLLWCNEVVVVDDNSTDKTAKIARKLGARVYKHGIDNDFSRQRNFALRQAQGRWVLFVDADEIVSKELADEIKKAIRGDKYLGFFVKRQDFWMGKLLEFGESGQIKLLRLGRRSGGKWSRGVHEIWNIEGKKGTLANPLFHYPNFTLTEFIGKINFYSTLHARENLKEGKRVSFLKVIFWPPLKFVNNFIFKSGFRDGIHGFILAVVMSIHSFLAWGKLWLISKEQLKFK